MMHTICCVSNRVKIARVKDDSEYIINSYDEDEDYFINSEIRKHNISITTIYRKKILPQMLLDS